MGEVFLWSGIYLATMLLGYVLKRLGVFKAEDKKFLADLIFYVTLPAMLASSFTGVTVDLWLLAAIVLGFLTNVLMVVVAMFNSRRKDAGMQALFILNGAGLNLGNITMPFLRNFYPTGIPYMCMFDVGDAAISLGTTYALACMKLGEKSEGSRVRAAIGALLRSVSFDTYLLMTVLTLLHIQLPAPLRTFLDFAGKSNGFLAMLLVGIGLELHLERKDLGNVVLLLAGRYTCGIVMALVIWFLIPAPLLMRQVLVLAVFSPAPSGGLIFTNKLKLRVEIASALTPITTILMIPIMSAIMLMIG